MTTTSIIIIHRVSDTSGRQLSARLLRSQSMRNGGHACYRWSAAVDDGEPGYGRTGWDIAPRREYATVVAALRAAMAAGWHISVDG